VARNGTSTLRGNSCKVASGETITCGVVAAGAVACANAGFGDDSHARPAKALATMGFTMVRPVFMIPRTLAVAV
jgi:hypothetical protein